MSIPSSLARMFGSVKMYASERCVIHEVSDFERWPALIFRGLGSPTHTVGFSAHIIPGGRTNVQTAIPFSIVLHNSIAHT